MEELKAELLYRENYESLALNILQQCRLIEKTILPTLELAYLRGKQHGEELERENHNNSSGKEPGE